MTLNREHVRKGWIIMSGDHPWDDWIYPSEEAARETAERCDVPSATVVEGQRQGHIDNKKRQFSERLLYDRKRGRG
ncbi:hypothetical protein N7E70_018290 [Aminobacter sp. NyZ550]|uniref:hypothetical protein n=1 Tax=Aminobacter sp. NyZ550 TaxID=2979870 RepID=UPI0021D59B6C|nr:hypothetical protein [Aminobacter sp. NyZ550]WAX93627.1 hypothetical protein N7E70_018290 [Aminobacter sp. NyZ550]